MPDNCAAASATAETDRTQPVSAIARLKRWRHEKRPSLFAHASNEFKRTIVLAQEEARDLRDDYIGTEHLVLGLLRAGHQPPADCADGLDLDATRAWVASHLSGRNLYTDGFIPFTPRTNRALKLAARAAGDGPLEPAHLWWAVTTVNGLGAELLVSSSVRRPSW